MTHVNLSENFAVNLDRAGMLDHFFLEKGFQSHLPWINELRAYDEENWQTQKEILFQSALERIGGENFNFLLGPKRGYISRFLSEYRKTLFGEDYQSLKPTELKWRDMRFQIGPCSIAAFRLDEECLNYNIEKRCIETSMARINEAWRKYNSLSHKNFYSILNRDKHYYINFINNELQSSYTNIDVTVNDDIIFLKASYSDGEFQIEINLSEEFYWPGNTRFIKYNIKSGSERAKNIPIKTLIAGFDATYTTYNNIYEFLLCLSAHINLYFSVVNKIK